jgi:hypothetical protein
MSVLGLRHIRIRRQGNCAPEGTLVPGLARPGFKRAGHAVCCEDTGLAHFKRSSFRRVGKVPDPCSSCTPGTIVFDQTIAPVVEVASSAVAVPPYGVYVIPIGALTCPTYQLEVTADCAWNGLVGGIRNGGAIHTYLAATGSDLPTRAFVAGNNLPTQLANIPANESDHVYRTYTFKAYPAGAPALVNFAGPLADQSLYLWPPVLFPDFIEGDWLVKNVHVRITAT